ncbi:MAG TPA: sulfite exporter TauE/SafE family protein, partial [Polyangiaceae bacterium]|nr:sulfite exporter TauE/SafE family protein [Polyangiaceae bacterium]
MTNLVSVVVASVLGSVHCAGMCGGLVGFYSAGAPARRPARWAAHGAYHGTRLAAYVALGASAGAFGAALDGVGRSLGFASLGAACAVAVLLSFGVPALSRGSAPSRLLQLGANRPRSLRERLEAGFAALAVRARQRPPL